MADMLDYISTWSVLKWVLLVLIAGFIGQFGRMMAEAVMNRMRRRRALQGNPPPDDGGDQRPPVKSAIEPLQDAGAVPPAPSAVPDKKWLKAMAKARKKEAKKK